jgi:hypothetical protein
LVCHWVGGGTRRKGGRPAEFTSEIANMKIIEKKKNPMDSACI